VSERSTAEELLFTIIDPSWSADGKTIAFTSNRTGDLEIYSMNTLGGNQTRLTTDPAADLVPSYPQPLRR